MTTFAEMSERIAAAASRTGIGLTLLPVHYQFGGMDRRPLGPGQQRFGTDSDGFVRLLDAAEVALRGLPPDAGIGVSPHSLRAVSPEALALCATLRPDRPLHMHLAEQIPEVEEVVAATGRRPVEWLLDHHVADRRWTLIHLTHMSKEETRRLAVTGAVASPGCARSPSRASATALLNGTIWKDAGGRLRVRVGQQHPHRARRGAADARIQPAAARQGAGDPRRAGAVDGAGALRGRARRRARPRRAGDRGDPDGLWADLCAISRRTRCWPAATATRSSTAWSSPAATGWCARSGRPGDVVREGRHLERARIEADYLACIAGLEQRM